MTLREHTLLPLRTGVTEFPWAAVVEAKSPEIDLGDWDAAPVPATGNDNGGTVGWQV